MASETPSPTPACPRVTLQLAAGQIPRFFLLLQQGVTIHRRVGCSVESFLREQIGARTETVALIQSVMLDGKPVDDIGATPVRDGSTLAFSAAMPGLVGATLRRGGTYASFRGGITHREAGGPCASGEGWVTVKLFNLVMAELGPGLLRAGVLVRIQDLLDLLAGPVAEAGHGVLVTLDGAPIDGQLLREAAALRDADRVLLFVLPDPPAPGRGA